MAPEPVVLDTDTLSELSRGNTLVKAVQSLTCRIRAPDDNRSHRLRTPARVSGSHSCREAS